MTSSAISAEVREEIVEAADDILKSFGVLEKRGNAWNLESLERWEV
jgi:hypothetical protein